MRVMNTAELSSMEVINLCDGARLGCPSCFEINIEDGQITALLIPQGGSFSLLGKTDSYRIPWCKVQCIGEDTILVKLTDGELSSCLCKTCKGKRGFFC